VVARTSPTTPLAAVGYWAFDIGALWASFHAFGNPPPGAVLVVGYFVGTLANTLPRPGALAYVRLRGTVARWRSPATGEQPAG
jgi:hypothetical protein